MKKLMTIIVPLLLLLAVFASCSSVRRGNCMRVYERIQSGAVWPTFIVLKYPEMLSEYYAPQINLSTVGEWSVKGDTLSIKPIFEYSFGREGLELMQIADSDELTVSSIPQTYLIKDDMLIDMTDYSPVFAQMGMASPYLGVDSFIVKY